MKIADVKNEEGRFYLQTWLKALGGLLGWSEEQVLTWAEKWQNDLNNPDCLFFHEPPLHYVLKLLIPKSLDEKFVRKRPLLRRVVLAVIESTESFNYYKNPKFDWNLAKRRMKVFFEEAERQKGPMDTFLLEYEKQLWGNE